MPTLYLFADSNLFIQYKPLHEVDWSQWGDFDHIEIMVCATVQTEIDSLKDGREGRRSDRARRAASTFLDVDRHGPKELRATPQRVMLNLYRTPRPNQDLADHLDYTQNDDRIIGHLAQFREENPSADARLFTGDSGPYVKAGNFGIPREFIPDDWRLTPEPDDRQRKIQELTKQIEELQAQEPKFNFSCAQQSEARPGHIEIVYPAFLPLTAIEREQLLERLRELYPPTVVKRDSISVQSISEYEEQDHPAWISECEKVLDWVHYIVQLERCAELTVTIQNTGSRPATNALVDMRASGHFGLTTPIRELREFGLIPVVARPEPPPQPQPPASWSTIINDLTTPIGLPLEALNFASRFQNQEEFDYTAEAQLKPEPSIGLTCALWRHSLESKEFTIRLVPSVTDRPITGEITWTVHADNLTEPATHKLVVTLSPDYFQTMEPALEWFTTPHPDEISG